MIDGKLVRVVSWYDNEWGFSNRMVDTATAMAKLGAVAIVTRGVARRHRAPRACRKAPMEVIDHAARHARGRASTATFAAR